MMIHRMNWVAFVVLMAWPTGGVTVAAAQLPPETKEIS